MDRIRERIIYLRSEADVAVQRAEEAEKKNKQLEEVLLQREQEIKSKDHRLDDLEKNLEVTSTELNDVKEKLRFADVTMEHTDRKVIVLEQERDKWEKKYEEAESKYRQALADLNDLVVNMDNL